MNIKQIAEQFQITPRALRFWEQRGLIDPKRTARRGRDYSASDVQAVARIIRLQGMGFELTHIYDMAGREPTQEELQGRLNVAREAMKEAQARIDAITAAGFIAQQKEGGS